MDTTDPEIIFDEKGYCNHCNNALKKLNEIYFIDPEIKRKRLVNIVDEIKQKGKGKRYDCVIGLSGGVDSSYLAYIVVKELGLRPLAVHLDNGWNSELSVMNIENIVKKLGIDLITVVLDWDEFRDLQKAYLKASVIDLEVLSDNAIVVSIHRILKKFKLKYFLIGFNQAAESIMPYSWLYSPKFDSLNIKNIYKKFGNGEKLESYPLFKLYEYFHYRFFDKSRTINILDMIHYDKKLAINILEKELGWRNYGGKHYESIITKFYQSYILPVKFGIDKRRAHLSSLICSGQISRDEALQEMQKMPYDPEKIDQEKEYFIKKLGLSESEFLYLMKQPPISHFEYGGYNKMIHRISNLIKKIK